MVSTRDGDLPFYHSTPRLVREVIESPGLLDGKWLMAQKPHFCQSQADVEELAELIQSPARQLPIFAVSLDGDSQDSNDAVVDVEKLAVRGAGLAHVFLLSSNSTYHLTNLIGKEFSVYNGAVRTYFAGFDKYDDHPLSHPLALSERIRNWGERGSIDFAHLLINSAYRANVNRPDADMRLPRFGAVRAFVTRSRRQQAEKSRDETQLLELALEEVDQLNKDRSEWEDLAQAEQVDREQADRYVDDLQQELYRLRCRIGILEDRIESLSGASIDESLVIPECLDELQTWADENLAGRLVVTGRASRAAKNSPFKDVELAYRGILLLANEYRKMKVSGGSESKQEFESACNALGLECTKTFSGAGAGEYG